MPDTSVQSKLALTPETLRTWLLVAAFAYAPLGKFVRGVFYNIPFTRPFSGYVLTAIFLVLIALNLKTIIRFLNGWDLFFGTILLLVILISYLLYPENNDSIRENLKELFVKSLPFYVVGLLWRDDSETFHVIYVTALISVFLNVSYFLLFVSRQEVFRYDMSLAYAILPSVMVCAWWMMRQGKKLGAAGFSAGMLLLLFLGTRGPLVILVCYIVVLLWYRLRLRGRILLVIAAVLLIAAVLHTEVIPVVSKTLSRFALRHGFSTRIFDIAGEDEFFSDTSGRDRFYQIVTEKILERPLLGYGIYGEWQFIHNPTHRIWLEIWAHYGVILGSALMLFLISVAYRGIRDAQNEYIRGFIVLWAVHLAVRGVFGSSYLGFYSFFLWGLCANQIRAHRIRALFPEENDVAVHTSFPLKEGL